MVGITDRPTEKQWGNSRHGETALEGVRADEGHIVGFKRWSERGRKHASKK